MNNKQAYPWRFVTPLYLGSTLNPINSSVIATALVPIAIALHLAIAKTVVLVSVLYLASCIAQPTAGKLAEEFGPRRVFIAGILTVITGALIGGLGNDLPALIVARLLIGLGTSAGYPTAMLMIRRRAQEAGLKEPPGNVLGGLQIAGTVTAALGLPIGGVLVGAWGWRTTFFVSLPLALTALYTAVRWLPRDARTEAPRTIKDIAQRIDLLGIALFAATIASLLLFLFTIPAPRWWALVIAILLAVVLVMWELRTCRPFFDVRLLARNRALSRTYIRFALVTLCIYTVLYGLTQWLQASRHTPSREAGLLILPMSVLSAFLVHYLSKRNLVRGPLIMAAASSLLASAGVFLLSSGTPLLWIVVITLVFGVTMGTSASANQTALYKQVDGAQMGTAAGLLRTFAYIGSIASSALIKIAFHAGVGDHGLHTIALFMMAVSLLALILTLADKQLRSRSIDNSTFTHKI
ncbi:MAG TPA: MFS transporter [Puia sp.]|nr:MFS transporter [Puia sp.]